MYKIEDVLKILNSGDAHTSLWTRKCVNYVSVLALDIEDIRDLIKEAITHGQYINSEWCVQKPTGPWAACDGYRLLRKEWVEYAHKDMCFEYYIKFAIGKLGKLLLLVSCHMSQ